jgi:Outer membrane protein beta-barrel domain
MYRHCTRFSLAAALALTAGLALGQAPARAESYARYRARGRVYVHPRAEVGVVLVPQGFYVGAGLVGMHILSQSGGEELLDDGPGLTLYGGWRLIPRLALELGWTGTYHNPATVQTNFGPDTDYLILNAFTGDAKIYLGDQSQPQQFDPYVQGGLGVYLLDSTYFGAQSVGTGFQLGGGIDFHVAPQLDLGVRGLYRGIAMGPPNSNQNETFVHTVGIDGNLTVKF